MEQLDKEKRDLSERLRVLHKRIDHLERAYRKDEAPLLAVDYERQQEEDRVTHEKNAEMTLVAAQQKHVEDLHAKKRLARMTGDYHARRKEIAGHREEEFQRKRADAQKAMVAEKAARRQEILAQRAAEEEAYEAEERKAQEEEEERLRQEEGSFHSFHLPFFDTFTNQDLFVLTEEAAEEERVRAEEEAAAAAAEAEKKAAADKIAATRAAREAERQKDLETARLRAQREEEALARRSGGRKLETERSASSPISRPINGDAPSPISASASVGGGGVWRRGGTTPGSTTPPTSATTPRPVAAAAAGGAYRPPASRGLTPSNGTSTPLRSETPPSSGRPSPFGAARPREEVPARSSSPAPAAARPSPFGNAKPVAAPTEKNGEADGFQAAPSVGKWKPRTRGPGEAPPR